MSRAMPKDHLAQARMPIGAHHDEITAEIGGPQEQRVGW
jgi:hypothetical protein